MVLKLIKKRTNMKLIKTSHHLITTLLALAGLAGTSRAVDFHVATAQDLQNALTQAAGNGADNTIWITNGYYTGNFNYSSVDNNSLTIQPELGLTNHVISIDGGGGGRDINITCSSSSGNVTVNGLTFIRNCGSYQIGALRIAASTGGNITVNGCRFLSLTNSTGMGLEIAAGLNTAILNCTVTGTNFNNNFFNGNGINIAGVTGNTLIYNSSMSANYGNYGGIGANITASAVLTVSNNIFQGNSSGGLVFSPSSGSAIAQVQGNVFNGNGIYGSYNNPGAQLYCYALNLAGNVFSENGCGGFFEGGTVIATGNTFIGNNAGGAYFGSVTTIATGNMFTGNTLGSDGGIGGGACFQGTTNIVTSNTFNGNEASAGGGAFFESGFVTLSNNTFSANRSVGNWGGGVCISYSYYNENGTAIVSGNTFTGNSSSSSGGALEIPAYGDTTNLITGNKFEQNSAAAGGGAISDSATVTTISDNLVVNNTQSGAATTGGGIFVAGSSALYMVNNTIFGNTSGGGGGGAAFQTSGQTLVYNNIIWGNSASGSGSDVYISGTSQQTALLFNDINGTYGVWDIAQSPQLNMDPQFFNAVTGDFHFSGTSPCENMGTNGALGQPLTDLDGNLRTNTLGLIDLGCYEFNTTATHPADTNAAFTITSGEYASYAAAWKAGLTWTNGVTPGPNPISANYLTRAGYLMTNGGAYYNDGSARPVNWKPIQ